MFIDSPKSDAATLFSKFLPYNDNEDSDNNPYSSDQFRIYEFKVRKCTRSRSHDWTDCPFAHPGEKARRRDPRRYHYSGTICSEYRKGGYCSKGDECEYSHGVFECWLHPTRYRTEACKDGKSCKRKVCFFAHSRRQLRTSTSSSSTSTSVVVNVKDIKNGNLGNCCGYCCHCVNSSPNSTLLGGSQFSPPANGGVMRYKLDALSEVMASLEAMKVNELIMSSMMDHVNLGGTINDDQQTQFLMSPSTSSPGYSGFSTGRSNYRSLHVENTISGYDNNSESNLGGPDLGWVNDLLT